MARATMTADPLRPFVFRQKGHIVTAYGDGACIHVKAAGDGVEQGGLACAVGTDHRDKFSLVQMERQVRDGLFLIDGAGIEGLGDALNVQHVSSLPFQRPASAAGRPPTFGCWELQWPEPR